VDVWWVQKGMEYEYSYDVSVLVLVDVWWVQMDSEESKHWQKKSLGPCFSGCLVGTRILAWITLPEELSLGPCFSGCLVGTYTGRKTRHYPNLSRSLF